MANVTSWHLPFKGLTLMTYRRKRMNKWIQTNEMSPMKDYTSKSCHLWRWRSMRGDKCVITAMNSAVFSDFAAPLQVCFLRPRGLIDPEFLVSVTGQIFLASFRIIVHFGLVWLWHMIRQSRIHLNFLQNFWVHSWPLARSAAHTQLRGAAWP